MTDKADGTKVVDTAPGGPDRPEPVTEPDQPTFDKVDPNYDALPTYSPHYDDGEPDYDALPKYSADADDGELGDDTLPDHGGNDGVSANRGEPSAPADDPAPSPKDEPRMPAGGDKPGDLTPDPDDEVDPGRAAAIEDARAEVARGYDLGEARAEVDAAYARADDQGMTPDSPESFDAAAEAASDQSAARSGPQKEVEFVPPESPSDASRATETPDEQIPAEPVETRNEPGSGASSGGEQHDASRADPSDQVDPGRAAAIDDARAEVARGYDLGEARAEVDAAYAQDMTPDSPENFDTAAEAASDQSAARSGPQKEVEFVPPQPAKEVEFVPPGEGSADQWEAKFSADHTASVDLTDLPEIYQETKETIDNARQGVDRWDATDRARADKWFGDSSEGTRQQLQGVLANIDHNLDQVTLRPLEPGEVDPRTFAYVYPIDSSRTIYVGESFWQAGSSPPDSQAGILTHEMSHFRDVGGTIDVMDAYGEERSERLALSDPDRALRTADNFEYFVEEYQRGQL